MGEFWTPFSTATTWTWNDFPLGSTHIYDAIQNPSGTWSISGAPNWWNIKHLIFTVTFNQSDANQDYAIDGLYLCPERWVYLAQDATSISDYGQDDIEFTDNTLHSNADCEARAKTLLYQMKDPAIELTATTQGNNNLLVGDRVPVTIPAESITAADYDIIAVENFLGTEWQTNTSLVNSANRREPTPTDTMRLLSNLHRQMRQDITQI